MGLFIQKDGICKFVLNPAEDLVLNPGEWQTEFILNQSQAWTFTNRDIRQIRVVAHENLSYTPSPHVDYLRQLFEDLGIEKGVCVDIGAFDGLNHSNTIDLLRKGWSGLALECDPARFARLAEVYRNFKDANAARHLVTPDSIVPLLKAYGIPIDFDFLSLDIDSFDYYVLERLLSVYRPSVICTEINEVIPPPIRFAAHYRPDFVFDLDSRFYGQSLAMLADLAHQHNYVLLHQYYMDVFLIDARLISGTPPELDEFYREGVLNRPVPDYYSHYPFSVAKLWQATPAEGIELIKSGWPDTSRYHLSLEA